MEDRNKVNLSLFIQLVKVQQWNESKKKAGVSEPWICNWENQ